MRLHHVAVAAVCAAAVVVPALPAEAAPTVRFREVYYNSPGSDTGSNTSLNGEWIQIGNYGSTSRSLRGWTVRDKSGHTYTFGTFTLGARKIVTLRTGKGSNTQSTRYWGLSSYVWNNSGDTAYLRNSAGTSVDSCSWGSSGSYKYC
jgi:hypothetical protein